jgi:hypothetical protein
LDIVQYQLQETKLNGDARMKLSELDVISLGTDSMNHPQNELRCHSLLQPIVAERNVRVFRGQSTTPQFVVQKIKEETDLWGITLAKALSNVI